MIVFYKRMKKDRNISRNINVQRIDFCTNKKCNTKEEKKNEVLTKELFFKDPRSSHEQRENNDIFSSISNSSNILFLVVRTTINN